MCDLFKKTQLLFLHCFDIQVNKVILGEDKKIRIKKWKFKTSFKQIRYFW